MKWIIAANERLGKKVVENRGLKPGEYRIVAKPEHAEGALFRRGDILWASAPGQPIDRKLWDWVAATLIKSGDRL